MLHGVLGRIKLSDNIVTGSSLLDVPQMNNMFSFCISAQRLFLTLSNTNIYMTPRIFSNTGKTGPTIYQLLDTCLYLCYSTTTTHRKGLTSDPYRPKTIQLNIETDDKMNVSLTNLPTVLYPPKI